MTTAKAPSVQKSYVQQYSHIGLYKVMVDRGMNPVVAYDMAFDYIAAWRNACRMGDARAMATAKDRIEFMLGR